jgi:hypothetical protein
VACEVDARSGQKCDRSRPLDRNNPVFKGGDIGPRGLDMQRKSVKVSGGEAYREAVRPRPKHNSRKFNYVPTLATTKQVQQLLRLKVRKPEAMSLSESSADLVVKFLKGRQRSIELATPTQVARLVKLGIKVEKAAELLVAEASKEIERLRQK